MSLVILNPLNLSVRLFPVRLATKYLVIHCAATRPHQDIGAKEIHSWHTAKGWKAIGYHHVIRRDGTIERGRPLTAQGSHVAGYNSISLGICLVGGLSADRTKNIAADNFTAHQYEALRDLLRILTKTYPGSIILGHRDLSPDKDGDGVIKQHEWLKSCPSFSAHAWARKVGLA